MRWKETPNFVGTSKESNTPWRLPVNLGCRWYFFQRTFYVSSFSCFSSRHGSLEGKSCWSAAGGVSKATILSQSPLLWMIVSCSHCTSFSLTILCSQRGEGNQTKPNPKISSFWFFCFISWFIFWMQDLIHPRYNANLLFIVIGGLHLKKQKQNTTERCCFSSSLM